jgi:hypothetical protein
MVKPLEEIVWTRSTPTIGKALSQMFLLETASEQFERRL